jgi:hypothetical protein
MATTTKMASLGARTVQNATRYLASPPTVRVVACPFSCVREHQTACPCRLRQLTSFLFHTSCW